MASHQRPSRSLHTLWRALAGLFAAILFIHLCMAPRFSNGPLFAVSAVKGITLSADEAPAGEAANAPKAPDSLTIALSVSVCACLVLAFALIRTRQDFHAERERMRADRLRLQLSEERYRLLALSSDVVVFDLNITDKTIEASENFESLLGQCPDLNHVLTVDRIHPDDRDTFALTLQEAVSAPQSVSCELRLLNGSNKYVWYSVLLSSFADDEGNVLRVIGKLTNIDREKREKSFLELCAKTDMMTGLFNKVATEDLISLSISEGQNQTDALLILDVDNLKLINDTLGHAEGDKAILEVAETLKKHFRSTDIIGRVGGDEFMVFLRNIGNESRLRNSLSTLVQKLSRIRLGETRDVQLHASIGAVVSTGADSFETLYKRADKAMYFVKRNGKNDYAFYSPEMEQVNYQFPGNVSTCTIRSDLFDAEELDQLLNAVAVYFSLVIFASLTKNRYFVVDCEGQSGFPNDSGIYDNLVEEIGNIFYPERREEFAEAFSREALIHAYGRGERSVSFESTRPDGNVWYQRAETTAVFAHPEKHGEICAILLVRES